MKKLLIKFSPDVTGTQIQAALTSVSATTLKTFTVVSGLLSISVADADYSKAKDLAADFAYILYVEDDVEGDYDYVVNDPLATGVGTADWYYAKIGAPAAWDIKRDAQDIKVGVIDSGCRITHEDLIQNLYTDPDTGEIGYNCAEETYDVTDLTNHGTRTAGVVGARANNAKGGAGICHTVKLIPLKIEDDDRNVYASYVIRAIEYAIEKGINVVNLSFGFSEYSAAYEEAFDAAEEVGLIVCCSAGNVGTNLDLDPGNRRWPTCFTHSNIIVTLATDQNDAPFSTGWNTNFGQLTCDVGAPGESSSTHSVLNGVGSDVTYGSFGGTSGASPMVAGTAALILAVMSKTIHGVPNHASTAALVKEVILSTVTPSASLSTKCVTGGVLNVAAAVAAIRDLMASASTLSEEIPGRSVKVLRHDRNDATGRFDVDIEIEWVLPDTLTAPISGAYDTQIETKQFLNAAALPLADDLEPLYDAPQQFTPTTETQKIPVLGERWVQTLTAPDPDTVIYYTCIKTGTAPNLTAINLTDTTYFTPQTVFGLWSIERRLTGPSGSGLPILNPDGTYSYAIVSTKTRVVDAAWHLFSGPNSSPERVERKVSTAPQQIRRRIGGELEYRKDADGKLCGIRWDNAFDVDRNYGDTNTPAAWITKGYQAKYGNWNPDWEKSFSIDLVAGTSGHRLRAVNALASVDNHILYGGSGQAIATEINDVFFAQDTQTFYVSKKKIISYTVDLSNSEYPYSIGQLVWCEPNQQLYISIVASSTAYLYTNATYWQDLGTVRGFANTNLYTAVSKANVRTTCPAMGGYIARRGVGSYPMETPDYYIPILQPLEREVLWDNNFDADFVYGATAAPAAWASEHYDDLYGAWRGWEKHLLINGVAGTGGHVFKAIASVASEWKPDAATRFTQINEVIFAQDTQLFYKANRKITDTSTGSASAYSYLIGTITRDTSGAGTSWYLSKELTTGTAVAFSNTTYWESLGTNISLTNTTLFTSVTKANLQVSLPSMPAKIAMRGVGSYPQEEVAQIEVLAGDGSYALSSSARVSFYTNLAENPRWLDIYEALIQRVESIGFRTYFAFNPHWMIESHRRIPVKAALDTEAEKLAYAVFLTGNVGTSTSYLSIPYAADGRNFTLKLGFRPLTETIWAGDVEIEIRGPMEADVTKLQERIDALGAYSTGAISGCRAMIYTDLTALLSPPWTGSFKELG